MLTTENTTAIEIATEAHGGVPEADPRTGISRERGVITLATAAGTQTEVVIEAGKEGQARKLNV